MAGTGIDVRAADAACIERSIVRTPLQSRSARVDPGTRLTRRAAINIRLPQGRDAVRVAPIRVRQEAHRHVSSQHGPSPNLPISARPRRPTARHLPSACRANARITMRIPLVFGALAACAVHVAGAIPAKIYGVNLGGWCVSPWQCRIAICWLTGRQACFGTVDAPCWCVTSPPTALCADEPRLARMDCDGWPDLR